MEPLHNATAEAKAANAELERSTRALAEFAAAMEISSAAAERLARTFFQMPREHGD